MGLKEVLLKLIDQIQNKKPCVLYSLPNENAFHFAWANELIEIHPKQYVVNGENGFFIRPFDDKIDHNTSLLIPYKEPHFSISQEQFSSVLLNENQFFKEQSKHLSDVIIKQTKIETSPFLEYDYISSVEKAVEAIENGEFEKVVLSKVEAIQYASGFDLLEKILQLKKRFPETFISFQYTEKYGAWLGASPEILLTIDQRGAFKTVALAGTQTIEEDQDLIKVAWTQKEIEEQAMVTRYIINCFKKIRVRKFKEIGPRTTKTGGLAHLKTVFTTNIKELNFPELGDLMLQLLHPTSAVCGLPKESSKDYILKNEPFDRQIFTGVIGPIGVSNQTKLFVNLRCGQFVGKSFLAYAGAGLTRYSQPMEEEKEIENKIKAMKNIVQ